MVEVNISLKCHWKQSADKKKLYLGIVKSLVGYMRRSSGLTGDYNKFTAVSFGGDGELTERV